MIVLGLILALTGTDIIPSNVVMALMIGALIIQGVIPGPGVIQQNPALFWGIIA